jgi:class 3 adenylate cyclase
VSLGHRRQLLREFANLDKTAAAPPSAPSVTAPPVAAPTVAPQPEATGERRHVTVMFCDLLDSTGIAAKLDAEEWRDLVGAYVDAASTAVSEMGGKVAKKLGDGLMALFGYPVAQENDAERAVRAALSIQRALAELNRNNERTGRPAARASTAGHTASPFAAISLSIHTLSFAKRPCRLRQEPVRRSDGEEAGKPLTPGQSWVCSWGNSGP